MLIRCTERNCSFLSTRLTVNTVLGTKLTSLINVLTVLYCLLVCLFVYLI